MKPQSKLWKLIPQQSCGVLNPPPSAGLFDLQISMHCVFEIWVSRINTKLQLKLEGFQEIAVNQALAFIVKRL